MLTAFESGFFAKVIPFSVKSVEAEGEERKKKKISVISGGWYKWASRATLVTVIYTEWSEEARQGLKRPLDLISTMTDELHVQFNHGCNECERGGLFT